MDAMSRLTSRRLRELGAHDRRRPTRRRRPDVSSMPPRRGGSVRSGGFCEPECMERYEPSAWAQMESTGRVEEAKAHESVACWAWRSARLAMPRGFGVDGPSHTSFSSMIGSTFQDWFASKVLRAIINEYVFVCICGMLEVILQFLMRE